MFAAPRRARWRCATALLIAVCATSAWPEATANTTSSTFVLASERPIADSYTVTLKGEPSSYGQNVRAAQSLAQRYGGKLTYTFQSVLHGFTVKMSEKDARRLAADPAVARVEQNQWIPAGDPPPSVQPRAVQPVPTSQWNLDRIDQRTLDLDGQFNGDDSQVGANTSIYILDTGVRQDHLAFGNRVRFGADFTDDPAEGYDPGEDCSSFAHGTGAAGLAAGGLYTFPGTGEQRGHGIARGAEIVNVKMGNCDILADSGDMVSAVDWVINDPDRESGRSVVNLSWEMPNSTNFRAGLQELIDSGTTVVIAAGNDNANICSTPAMSLLPFDVILVGGTDKYDNRASFSNYGSCVDIWAPAKDVITADNLNIFAAGSFDGTSYAAPIVAGAAAALQSRGDGWSSPSSVKSRLFVEATHDVVNDVGTSNDALVHVSGRYKNNNIKELVDNGQVLSEPITISDQGDAFTTRFIRVFVHIGHDTRGQLTVELIAPDGTAYPFRYPSGDTADDIIGEFAVDASDEPPNGSWRLRITDNAAGPTSFKGYLAGWRLQL